MIKLSRLLGWMCFHTHDSRRSEPGFPDLVLVKSGRPVIYAELKTDTGKPTPAQRDWLDALNKAEGTRAFLWRPADLEDIAAILGE